jgi:hypothetical protein
MRRGIFSWALASLKPTSFFPIFFFLIFHGGSFATSSTEFFRL